MIPRASIVEWRQKTGWQSDAQVEQDLLICRVLTELFSNSFIADHLLFRGGTALHKIFLTPSTRYSEDIDLVQKENLPIGKVMDRIKMICTPLLGKPKTKQKLGSVSFHYRFSSEISPITPLRLKIEINTREHFSVFDTIKIPFSVSSRWFSSEAKISTYSLEELLGTKMRALYQRSKGRDLYDLWYGLELGDADPQKIVACFFKYIQFQNLKISKNEFSQNLSKKMDDPSFTNDIYPLLHPKIKYSVTSAYDLFQEKLLSRM